MNLSQRAVSALLFFLALGVISGSSPAVEWRSAVKVPNMGGSYVSRVAVSRTGTVAVLGEANCDGYVSIRRSSGVWSGSHRVGSSHTLISSVNLTFDAHGRLFVIWTQTARVGTGGCVYHGRYEVMTQTWTPSGGWGKRTTLGRAAAFLLSQSRMARNPHGDVIAFWRGYRHSGKHLVEVTSTRLRAAEQGWQALQQTPGGGPYRDVALDDKANAYAVWSTYGARNYFSMRPRRSGRWGSARRLPGGPASLPTVAANPDGTAVIAWRAAIVDSEGEGTQYGPPRAVVRNPNGSWSKVHVLSSIAVHEVNMAQAPNGTIMLFWAPQPIFGPQSMMSINGIRFSLLDRSRQFTAERIVAHSGLGPIVYRRNNDAILTFASSAVEGVSPRGQGPIYFSALALGAQDFSLPVPITPQGTGPALATPSGGTANVEAAMSFYLEADRGVYLSLLTRGALEP